MYPPTFTFHFPLSNASLQSEGQAVEIVMDSLPRRSCPGDYSKLNLRDANLARDHSPILPGCSCDCCKNHSRAYIFHLLNANEMLAEVLLYMHNLHHYLRFMEAIRANTEAGTFDKFKSEFLQYYSNSTYTLS